MEDDFFLDADLVEVVLAEAQESLEAAALALRENVDALATVDALFRCYHSMKGNCAMAGRTDLADAAHSLENVLDSIRVEKRALRARETRFLEEINDLLASLLVEDLDELRTRLAERVAAFRLETTPPQSSEEPAPSSLLERGGGSEARDGSRERADARLKVDAESIHRTVELAGELFQLDERLKNFVTRATRDAGRPLAGSALDELNQIAREFDGRIEKLYEILLDIQRLPLSQIVSPLEKALRDISRKTGKEIDFVAHGRDLRIDKQVLQTVRDPLMHMLRNSADHGIEAPHVRAMVGKEPRGRIALEVEETDGSVVFTLSDDGAGIDLRRVLERARARGLVSEGSAANLRDEEILEFIFQPGFSTAEQVSELSGRGVGMDVVLQQIRAAGGQVHSSTVAGRGTTFRLECPKASSPVVDGLAVRAGATIHLLPLKRVSTFVGRSALTLVRRPDGRVLARLGDRVHPVFRTPGSLRTDCFRDPRIIGVLVQNERGETALLPVDDVLGRRKALLQTVHQDLDRANSFQACILGDGTMALSLDLDALLADPDHAFFAASEEELTCTTLRVLEATG